MENEIFKKVQCSERLPKKAGIYHIIGKEDKDGFRFYESSEYNLEHEEWDETFYTIEYWLESQQQVSEEEIEAYATQFIEHINPSPALWTNYMYRHKQELIKLLKKVLSQSSKPIEGEGIVTVGVHVKKERGHVWLTFPENKIPYMQDHSVWRGIPSGVKFVIFEKTKNECFKLVAEGYGALRDNKFGLQYNYGNGSIFVSINELSDMTIKAIKELNKR